MGRKKVFISFDYDHDRHYRYLLNALSANPRFDLEFRDSTPGEIQSNNVSRIKAVLTEKIRDAQVTLVLVGHHANSYHQDRSEIGERNWQWWEIKKSVIEGNKLIAVKIDGNCQTPEPLYSVDAFWVHSFDVEAIGNALARA